MKLRERNLAEARKWAEELNSLNQEQFDDQVARWRKHELDGELEEPFDQLRSRVVDAFDGANGLELTTDKMYPVDVEVGLALYEWLMLHRITIEDACNDNFWRYLSIVVFPDLTYLRWPKPEKEQREAGGRINFKRFFRGTRRIWVKTLWWYVHLSWQGDVATTREAIKEGTADSLSKFIETPGRGYRPEYYRAFMARYAKSPVKKSETFAAAKKLSNARCRLIEPELTPGGVVGYCDQLFSEIERSR